MKAAKSIYLLVFLAFWLNFVVTITIADAQKVHALLVIMDDDPSIGRNVEVDRKRVKQLLKAIENEICEVEITTLLSSKDTATRDGILRWVRHVDVTAEDIVFIYYAGHGGMKSHKETFLATEGQWIFRSELVKAIEVINEHRLTILITDCCSSLVQSEMEPMLQSSRTMTRLTERVLRNLFFEHEGFLHVTAATEGQFGWSNTATGGWFTKNFIQALDSNPDENQDSFLSWEEVFVKAKADTERTFSQTTFTMEQMNRMRYLGITSQTPKAYSLPTPLGGPAIAVLEARIVNYVFLTIILSTLVISNLIFRILKKRHVSRSKLSSYKINVFAIILVEVFFWIRFYVPEVNWVLLGIAALYISKWVFFRKKRRYAQ